MIDKIQTYLKSENNDKDIMDVVILLLNNIKTIVIFIIISILISYLYLNFYNSKSIIYKLELIEKKGISPKFDYSHLLLLQDRNAIEQSYEFYIKRILYSSVNIEKALNPIKSVIIEDVNKNYESFKLFLLDLRNNIEVLHSDNSGIIEIKFISSLDYETIQIIFQEIISFSNSEGIKDIFFKLNESIVVETISLEKDLEIAKLSIEDRINILENLMTLDKNLSLIDSDRRYAEIGKNLNIAKQLEIKSPIENLSIVANLMKNESENLRDFRNTNSMNKNARNDESLEDENSYTTFEKKSLLNSILIDEYSGFPRQSTSDSFMLGEDILQVLLDNENKYADDFATRKYNSKEAAIKYLKEMRPEQFLDSFFKRNFSINELKKSYDEIYANFEFYLSDNGPFYFYDTTDISSENTSTSYLKVLIIFLILGIFSALVWIIFKDEYKKKKF